MIQKTSDIGGGKRERHPELGEATKTAWLIKDIEHAKMKILSDILLQYDIFPGQPRLMHLIWRHPGSTQREIADLLRVSPSSLSMSIKRLEKADLVRREVPDSDQRRNMIYLTEKGDVVLQACHHEMIDMHESMFHNLSESERQDLQNLLKKVLENVGQHPLSLKATSCSGEQAAALQAGRREHAESEPETEVIETEIHT